MWKYLVIGGGVALSAALQPGPLQAFYFSKVTQQGWKRTLPAAFSPLISDGPIAVISLLLIQQLPEVFRNWLQIAGGFLLLYFAFSTIRSWRTFTISTPGNHASTPKTVLQAALVNILNPSPYLGWGLVMGPAVLSAWSEHPIYALGMLLAFYVVMISTSLLLISLMGTTSLMSGQGRRSLILISGLLLSGLGFFYLYNGMTHLLSQL